MSRKVAVVVSIFFVLSLGARAFSADSKGAIRAASGSVEAIDKEARTITVKGEKGETSVCFFDDKTVLMGSAARKVTDIKAGDVAVILYVETDGRKMALSIAVVPSSSPSADKGPKP